MPPRYSGSRAIEFRRAAAAVVALSLVLSFASCETRPAGDPGPRHVILVIGDGMGRGTEVAASRYLHGRDDGLAWEDFPVSAWVSTWDVTTYNKHAAALSRPAWSPTRADPLLGYDPGLAGPAPWPEAGALDSAEARSYLLGAATDSAAAATAMATGFKTDSGKLAMAADAALSLSLETLAEAARKRLGAAIGLVTTVPFDHATPAAFVVHSGSRGSYASIAASIIGVARPEVVIGGGHPDFRAAGSTEYLSASALASLRKDGRWVLAERKTGQDGRESLASAALSLGPGQGLFGLFGGTDGAFEAPLPAGSLDGDGHPLFTRGAEDPSLAAAAALACEVLARDGDGFFLVVEQGDIDWANHANAVDRMYGAMSSLDEAVRAIEAFVDRPGDDIDWDNSLLVVTADHSTGLVRFAGDAVSYNSSGHANELVTLRARGTGAEAAFADLAGPDHPGSGIIDNTAISVAIRRFLGL